MGGKNIALCFSGQLRNHKVTSEFWLNNFIKPIIEDGNEITIFFNILPVGKETINKIKSIYKNLNVIIREENDHNYKELTPKTFTLKTGVDLPRGHSQLIGELYFFERVIDLKREYENKKKIIFDFVIKTRCDVFPVNKLDLSYISDNLSENDFIISNHDHHAGINARFSISKSKTSDVIFKIMDSLKEHNYEFKHFTGEPWWRHHLSKMTTRGINVKFLNYLLFMYRSDHRGNYLMINGMKSNVCKEFDFTSMCNNANGFINKNLNNYPNYNIFGECRHCRYNVFNKNFKIHGR